LQCPQKIARKIKHYQTESEKRKGPKSKGNSIKPHIILFSIISLEKVTKILYLKDFFARYYLQDDAEVDSDLSNPKSTALQAKHKSDKTIRMTSSEFQVTPSCFCKGSKYVSSPKGIIFLFLFPTFLKLFYI